MVIGHASSRRRGSKATGRAQERLRVPAQKDVLLDPEVPALGDVIRQQ